MKSYRTKTQKCLTGADKHKWSLKKMRHQRLSPSVSKYASLAWVKQLNRASWHPLASSRTSSLMPITAMRQDSNQLLPGRRSFQERYQAHSTYAKLTKSTWLWTWMIAVRVSRRQDWLNQTTTLVARFTSQRNVWSTRLTSGSQPKMQKKMRTCYSQKET